MPVLAEKIGADYGMNDGVLRMMGVSDNDNINKVLFGVVAVLMTIIIIASISLIYNSFSIAVSERQKQFGNLRSVGATPRQIRQIVYWEAGIIGLVAFPIGIISSLAGIKAVLMIINYYLGNLADFGASMKLVVSSDKVALSLLFLMVTLFLSTYIPAKRSGRSTIIAGIRQQNDIVIPKHFWISIGIH